MLAADKGESKDYSAAITVVELLRLLKPLNATERAIMDSEVKWENHSMRGLEQAPLGTKH